MDATTRDTVLAQNPWMMRPEAWRTWLLRRLPETYIDRALYDTAGPAWSTSDKAHLLVGPRQVGKTTLLWKHAERLGPRCLFLTLEDARVREWCSSAAPFLRDLRAEFGDLAALFLDEIQHLPEAALFVKQVVDLRPGFPLLVSGSSAFHLRSKTREALAGRATRSLLLPLSVREMTSGEASPSRAARQARRDEIIARQLRYGGYPEVFTGDAPEPALDALVETFLQRDASDLFRIRRPDAMRKLLELAARQTGSLVNMSEWASLIGVTRDTVAEYLEILTDAHILASIPVFAGGKRAELTRRVKIVFIDAGVRNAVLREFRPLSQRVDAGATLEGWVYGELRKELPRQVPIRYWRTRSGAEVDYVIDHGALTAIEVKAAALTRPALSRSARSFISAYRPGRFIVVNRALAHQEEVDGTTVLWTPLAQISDLFVKSSRSS